MAVFRFFTRRAINDYRKSGADGVSKRMGFPVVLLTTRGAKSGQERTVPIGGFPDGPDRWLVVASLGGAVRHPAWYLNMAKYPNDVQLEVGNERFRVRAELLQGDERSEALAHISSISARYGTYQQKTDREIPIVRLIKEPFAGSG